MRTVINIQWKCFEKEKKKAAATIILLLLISDNSKD